MSLKFEGKITDKSNFIKRLNEVDKLSDKNEILNLIGIAWIGQLKTNFKNSQNPFQQKWAGVNYFKYRENGNRTLRNRNPLLDNGRLVSSFQYKITNNTLYFGSELEYARAHNEGLNGITKRIILPKKSQFKNSNFQKKAVDIFNKYIDKKLGK